jgi:hypothetical protein
MRTEPLPPEASVVTPWDEAPRKRWPVVFLSFSAVVLLVVVGLLVMTLLDQRGPEPAPAPPASARL